MGFNAKIILDSVAPCGKRLTTIKVTYPRFIHSEVLMHRDRARNSASSRAIPFAKLNQMVISEPVIPLKWGMEQSGMQTGDEIPEPLRPLARAIWLKARDSASKYAKMLHHIEETALVNNIDLRLQFNLTAAEETAIIDFLEETAYTKEAIRIHKSIPNRIIEPWMWITVLITATEWKNFFRLRCHKDAEVHFQKIAGMMREEIEKSTPTPLKNGDWHMPYILEADWHDVQHEMHLTYEDQFETLCRVSAARCARLSYLTHDTAERNIAKDLGLFNKLNIGSGEDLPHASPYEHVAQALSTPERSGPFIGWKQFRKFFPNENVEG